VETPSQHSNRQHCERKRKFETCGFGHRNDINVALALQRHARGGASSEPATLYRSALQLSAATEDGSLSVRPSTLSILDSNLDPIAGLKISTYLVYVWYAVWRTRTRPSTRGVHVGRGRVAHTTHPCTRAFTTVGRRRAGSHLVCRRIRPAAAQPHVERRQQRRRRQTACCLTASGSTSRAPGNRHHRHHERGGATRRSEAE
jgi:hypothetical protein